LKVAAGIGDGPIDAVSNAIWQMVDPSLKLVDYHLKAITGGTDALADVSIKLIDANQNTFMARAVDEDVIRASAKAIIKGINKALNYREKFQAQE
jgi:2-isopropylmalate synthase